MIAVIFSLALLSVLTFFLITKTRWLKLTLLIVLLLVSALYLYGFYSLNTALEPQFSEVNKIEEEAAKTLNRPISETRLKRNICYLPVRNQDLKIRKIANISFQPRFRN